uniref:Movement protein BC1 n=1 Tax=Horsegram yellow mosaic virus TaxID=263793 RepID=A0A6B9PGJ4_9GEMI|nr:movement protein [Horsegram yellow mosaic virus]QHD57757.1 movement protein [Horsegram yellow mosaic virus]QHD57765.1 movement protein [Horsegram yellow mosaic virus]UVN12688.1 movement protein [Horsegram yellow mosaic virus]
MEHYSGAVVNNKYVETKSCEYRLTNNETPIKLQFPSYLEQKTVQIMGKCMKVDHAVIEYRNQVPFNAEGSVVVTIRDTRLSYEQAAQAAFTFPIGCNVDLHYFSSSFFSLKDDTPWEIVYKVEDSNVIDGTTFAQIKAKLKLSSAKHSTDIRFKPPTINILSKDFTKDCVDFWSVERPKPIRRLLNPGPKQGPDVFEGQRPITLQPGETWATKSSIGRSASMRYTTQDRIGIQDNPTTSDADYPLRHLHKLHESSLDPGDSISQTQSNAMSRKDMEDIIESAINKCLITQKSTVNKTL